MVAGKGIDPVVQMGTLEELLTGRVYDEIQRHERCGKEVAMRDGGKRLVLTVTDTSVARVTTSLGTNLPPSHGTYGVFITQTNDNGHNGDMEVNTVTTNVPGPRVQLFAAGHKMLEAFPYVPLAGQVRIGVAIFSYLDTLNFGVTGDYDSNPDLDVLAQGICAGLSDLKKAAEAPPGG